MYIVELYLPLFLESHMSTESMRHAIAAKVQYESFVALSLGGYGVKPHVSTPVEYEQLEVGEMIADGEIHLAQLHPMLEHLSEEFGYRYEAPALSEYGARLIAHQPMHFIKEYALRLKNMERDPFATMFI